jgi:hypothetical protein
MNDERKPRRLVLVRCALLHAQTSPCQAGHTTKRIQANPQLQPTCEAQTMTAKHGITHRCRGSPLMLPTQASDPEACPSHKSLTALFAAVNSFTTVVQGIGGLAARLPREMRWTLTWYRCKSSFCTQTTVVFPCSICCAAFSQPCDGRDTRCNTLRCTAPDCIWPCNTYCIPCNTANSSRRLGVVQTSAW